MTDPEQRQEWILTNGLGGYAMGTVDGALTRRYHGLLIAALPAGRTVLLSTLAERLVLPGEAAVELGAPEHFALDREGLPVWHWRAGDVVLERRLFMPHGKNAVHVSYEQLEGPPATLVLEPRVAFRAQDAAVAVPLAGYRLTRDGITDGAYTLYLASAPIEPDPRIHAVTYELEQVRGYDSRGQLWSPGFIRTPLPASFTASAEAGCVPDERAERSRRRALMARAPQVDPALVLAADAFVVEREQRRTVIAGYPWFGDWGRDTMIALEGLTLVTGRHDDARAILETFAGHVKDGLLPNLFPEGAREGLYHTADATLWFFHALDRYAHHSRDHALRERLMPVLNDILAQHLKGTRFGIHVAEDGLLTQGAPGYQLTWMDAKVGDFVVTPRRGKAVELNALFYNALCLMERWHRDDGDMRAATRLRAHAERLRTSFNQRFWHAGGEHLYDVVDGEQGDDPTFRPNQLFAVSLPHPVLTRARWAPLVEQVRARLLTKKGLRTLAPGHRDYQAGYAGDLERRDRAYHQGTVWPWLIGPFVDAWKKVHPGRDPEPLLAGLHAHLYEEGAIGSVSEICDGAAPHAPRGCPAQAWSVAELLRCSSR